MRKMKKIKITDKLLGQINLENIELQTDWREYMLHVKKYATATINKYSEDVTSLFIWNLKKNKNKSYIKFTKTGFMEYQRYCQVYLRWSSKGTLKRARTSFRKFSEYIVEYKHNLYPRFRNIVNTLPPIQDNPKSYTEEDLAVLLGHLYDLEQYEQACAIALVACSGMSAEDLKQMKASFFTNKKNVTKDGLCYKTPKVDTILYDRTPKKTEKYILKAPCQKYIKAWLKKREVLGVDIDNLFVTYNTGTDTWQQRLHFNEWFNRFSAIAGKRFSFNNLKDYTYNLLFNSEVAEDDLKLYTFFAHSPIGMARVDKFLGSRRRKKLRENKRRDKYEGILYTG